MGKIIKIGSTFVIAFAVFIQLLPFGRNHANPPVTSEPTWDSPKTRELAVRACFDCHSNETVWPWYSNIAPVSWLMQNDVIEGRRVLNFSDWNTTRRVRGGEIIEVSAEGEMPPASYMPLHPKAQLNSNERTDLLQGFQATFGR